MIDYSKLSEDAMMQYINQTNDVLQELLNNRKDNTSEFVEIFKDKQFKRILITGSGTSYHCGESARPFMEEVLGLPVSVEYPRIVENSLRNIGNETVVFAISQSGESKSTIDAIKYLKEKGAYIVTLSENADGHTMAGLADVKMSLGCGEELAGPKTKGYEASIFSLMLSAFEAATQTGRINDDVYNSYISSMQKTIDNIPNVIAESEKWYERNRDELMEAKRFIVVGYSGNYGDVMEGRLKLSEAIRFGVEGYELEEFMHGIYHSINEDVQLFFLSQNGQFKERSFFLKNFLNDYSHHEYAIGNFEGMDNVSSKDLNTYFVDDPFFCCLEYIIPLQVLSYRMSKDKGINANIPKIPNFHHLMGSK